MGDVPWRVIVFGSRFYEVWQRVWGDLDSRLAEHGAVLVVHGDHYQHPNGGADWFARRWAERRRAEGWNVDHEPHPALWDDPCVHDGVVACPRPPRRSHRRQWVKRPGTYCVAAGLRRNQEMADLGADEALGYPLRGAENRGTMDMASRAGKAGIIVAGIDDLLFL